MAFVPVSKGGRRRFGASMNTTCNAFTKIFCMRNLCSVLLARDIEQHETEQCLSCADSTPSLTLESMERWLSVTKANAAVWSHRGEGRNVYGSGGKGIVLQAWDAARGCSEGARESRGACLDYFPRGLGESVSQSVRTPQRF